MSKPALNLDNKALKVNKLTKKYFYKSQNKIISTLARKYISLAILFQLRFLNTILKHF